MKKVINFFNKNNLKSIFTRNRPQNQGICTLDKAWLPRRKAVTKFSRMVFTKIEGLDELKQMPSTSIKFVFTQG